MKRLFEIIIISSILVTPTIGFARNYTTAIDCAAFAELQINAGFNQAENLRYFAFFVSAAAIYSMAVSGGDLFANQKKVESDMDLARERVRRRIEEATASGDVPLRDEVRQITRLCNEAYSDARALFVR